MGVVEVCKIENQYRVNEEDEWDPTVEVVLVVGGGVELDVVEEETET